MSRSIKIQTTSGEVVVYGVPDDASIEISNGVLYIYPNTGARSLVAQIPNVTGFMDSTLTVVKQQKKDWVDE